MNPIKLSFDQKSYTMKPTDLEIGNISKRIGGSPQQIKTMDEMRILAERIGSQGCSFCPATFSDHRRHQEGFEQQQLIAMDFDNDDPDHMVTFQEIKSRADYYEMPIMFAYNSMRSKPDHPKFRVVFLNDVPIPDRQVATAMQMAMGEIFPEADPLCYKDVSKLYLGGKELLYFDETIPNINIDHLFRSYTTHVRLKCGTKHFKEKLQRFSKKTGIALNDKGYLDVTLIDQSDEFVSQIHPTEADGASKLDQKNGGISPTAIIYAKNDLIIGLGEKSPFFQYYKIRMRDCTDMASVGKVFEKNLADYNHKQYRSYILKKIPVHCRLFREFESGEKYLPHLELFGLLNSLINVESGADLFLSTLSKYPEFYDKLEKWKSDVRYNIANQYRPQRCDTFCPYYRECEHSKNILTTSSYGRNLMEKIPDYHETYYSLDEVHEDIREKLDDAIHMKGNRLCVLVAQTGAGKSHAYLQAMQNLPGERFLVAAPTNLLKNELYKKACKENGVCVTPSLDEIKGEIPEKVASRIDRLYAIGETKKVRSYIEQVSKTEECKILKEYIEKRKKVAQSKGSCITTHRYFLAMDQERSDKFDQIIIDEDIIFKSVITSQCEVPLSELKRLRHKTSDSNLCKKINTLLKLAQTDTCLELKSIEYKPDPYKLRKHFHFDIEQFCRAERFYIRRASKEEKVQKDTVVFLKPAVLKNLKQIMVSATANEEICRQVFGSEVEFFVCKKAKYKGRLLQFPGRSMSRSSIANDPGIIRRLIDHFHMDEDHVITFMNQNIGALHFGNTEGSNALEGEDILVIGTPYHAPFLYKLVAFSLGFDINEEEEMTRQLVTHNGYQFWFNTFSDPQLRLVQFWMIESELEQAIGRARLLRHDCTVYLFSNFPLEQAEMVMDFDYSLSGTQKSPAEKQREKLV